MIFSFPYLMGGGGLWQFTLSQQQFFVINLVRFLHFNLKNFVRFEIFLSKWVVTLKIYLFHIARCYQSKMKMWKFVNHVKSLCPASSVILQLFIDYAILVEYFLLESLSEKIFYCCFSIILFFMSEDRSRLCTKLSMKVLQSLIKKLPNFSLIWDISS